MVASPMPGRLGDLTHGGGLEAFIGDDVGGGVDDGPAVGFFLVLADFHLNNLTIKKIK